MRVVALLVWFDEPPALLRECVGSWTRACDAVVAVDGAFRGFPRGLPSSPAPQADAIREAAAGGGMESVVYSPARLWAGHPEKRTAAWRLGEALTEPRDWFCVLDADEMLVEAGALPDAEAALVEVQTVEGFPVRQPRLMRAARGVEVRGLHYRYALPDGRFLWNYPGEPQIEPAPSPLRVLHRRDERGPDRLARQGAYYRQRREP